MWRHGAPWRLISSATKCGTISSRRFPRCTGPEGVLERVTFANPETGYTIARVAPERGELVTAVGPLLGAQVGEFLRLRGRWSSHLKYGRQFEVSSYTTVLPATEQG